MASGHSARFWKRVLDLAITLWVLRAVVIAILFGFVILGLAPQAQDLLVDVAAGPWWYIIVFLLAVFFVWALSTHFAARLLINTDARYLMRVRRRKSRGLVAMQKWTPRVLGVLPFAAMLIGVARSWNNVPLIDPAEVTDAAKSSLLLLGLYLVVSAALFWWYMATRERLANLAPIAAANNWVSVLITPYTARLPRALDLERHAPGAADQTSNLSHLYLLLMFLAFTCAPFFAPVWFAEMLPRAIAVPFVFAGWTPLAAYLSGVGRYLHVPIISLAMLGSVLLTYILGDNYSVRLVNAEWHAAALVKAQSGQPDDAMAAHRRLDTLAPDKRLKLHEAVQLWKRANGCEKDSTKCPRPIIVAASGGASRAGFFTASVLGKLIDDDAANRKRLFAISSVSGSSVGAVMTVAALAASRDLQPCQEQKFWLRYDPDVTDWQSCLEALMSGDFLTPVFAGLVFRDTLRFLGAFGEPGSALGWSDRATLLEQSWERHFHRSLKRPANQHDCVGNLDCPFLTLRAREVEGRVEWLPLLLLNGASVSTGQRIVTSTIDPWYRPSGECIRILAGGDEEKCPFLAHAFDFHWLIGGGDPPVGWISWLRSLIRIDDDSTPGENNDVRLSTAAHNSARFPFISPPGEIHNIENNVVDRIVDGGYFENFGAQTAVELAYAVRTVDPNLVPFGLIISNDPEIPTEHVLKAPNAGDGAFLPDLSAPAQTILNTRAARGTLAVDGVVSLLAEELTAECLPFAAHVRVWPEYQDSQEKKSAAGTASAGPREQKAALERSRRVRPLSFSWWLSKPVQLRLHQQTEFTSDDGDNKEAMLALSKALEAKPAGCTSKGQNLAKQKYQGVRTNQRQRHRQ